MRYVPHPIHLSLVEEIIREHDFLLLAQKLLRTNDRAPHFPLLSLVFFNLGSLSSPLSRELSHFSSPFTFSACCNFRMAGDSKRGSTTYEIMCASPPSRPGPHIGRAMVDKTSGVELREPLEVFAHIHSRTFAPFSRSVRGAWRIRSLIDLTLRRCRCRCRRRRRQTDREGPWPSGRARGQRSNLCAEGTKRCQRRNENLSGFGGSLQQLRPRRDLSSKGAIQSFMG